MKLFTLLSGTLCFLVILVTATFTTAGENRFVEIRKPFTSVYEFLDPKSNIIVQATKNDRFELIYEGTSWYQIKVKDKVGWVEKNAGIIVNNPGLTILSIPLGTLLFFLFLLIATISGASFLIYKQKTAEL